MLRRSLRRALKAALDQLLRTAKSEKVSFPLRKGRGKLAEKTVYTSNGYDSWYDGAHELSARISRQVAPAVSLFTVK